MTFTAALREYLKAEPYGFTPTLDELKCIVVDKDNREAYVRELRSYGYEIG